MFEVNQYSLLGALAGLLIGLVDVAAASRFLYPSMRIRHESAKANGRRTVKPNTVIGLLQFVGYIVMPIAGYVIANIAFNPNATMS